ncbi:hypothetical protein D3C75_899640 [compost metagenome]
MMVLSAPSALFSANTRATGSKRLARLPSSTAGRAGATLAGRASLVSSRPETLLQKPSSRVLPGAGMACLTGRSHWVLSLTACSRFFTGEFCTSLNSPSSRVAEARSAKWRTPTLLTILYQAWV